MEDRTEGVTASRPDGKTAKETTADETVPHTFQPVGEPTGTLQVCVKMQSAPKGPGPVDCVVCDGESPAQPQSPGSRSVRERLQPSCFPPGSVSPPHLPEKRLPWVTAPPSVLRTGPSTALRLLLSLGQSRRSGRSPPGWHSGTEAGTRGLRPVWPCPGSL